MATTKTTSVRTWTETRTIDGEQVSISHVNDISLSAGQIAMATGKEAYATIIECALRTRLGELPLDTGQGIPYFETVFNSSRLIPEFRSAAVARIEEFDFVQSVTSFDATFDRSSGKLSYTATVALADGSTTTVTSTV